MTYEQFKCLKPNAFKRRCGVHRETFEQMVGVLRPDLDRRGKRGGQAKLSALRPTTVGIGVRRESIAPSSTLLRVGD